jgi:hypothetical protein
MHDATHEGAGAKFRTAAANHAANHAVYLQLLVLLNLVLNFSSTRVLNLFIPFRRGEEKAHCILQTQLFAKCISYAVLWESTWPAVLYLD